MNRYGKPVLIAETDFPYTNSTNLLGFTATTNGQVDYVVALAQVVKGLPDGKGIGIVWWAAEYQALSGYNLSGFNQRSLFGASGSVLPAASALGQLNAPLVITGKQTNGALELNWPLSGAGLSLMAATNFSAPFSWQPATNSIQRTGMTFRVTGPMEGAGRLFRLQSN